MPRSANAKLTITVDRNTDVSARERRENDSLAFLREFRTQRRHAWTMHHHGSIAIVSFDGFACGTFNARQSLQLTVRVVTREHVVNLINIALGFLRGLFIILSRERERGSL